MADFGDFLDGTSDAYMAHHHQEFSDEQIEWLQVIYDEYANDDGEVDWSDHGHDSAWYYYLSEILGIDDIEIDKYATD